MVLGEDIAGIAAFTDMAKAAEGIVLITETEVVTTRTRSTGISFHWLVAFTDYSRFNCGLSPIILIEVFYNRQRRHSYLGYLCPEEFERQYASQ